MKRPTIVLSFLFISFAFDSVWAEHAEHNPRTRIVCQAQTIPAVYMDPDQFEVRTPRLMVFDQNEPHESSCEDILYSRTTGIPYTLYAASRLHRIDLFEDGMSDEDIEEIAKDIVSAEKNNPFSIERQSGKAPAMAEFRNCFCGCRP